MTAPEKTPGPFHGSHPGNGHSAVIDAAVELLEQQMTLLWHRERSMSRRMTRGHPEIEPAAYGLLVVLQREGPLRLTDIASILGMRKPSVSRHITSLEHRGLVRKDTDQHDARARTISLTPTGTRQLESIEYARAQTFHRLLANWDVKDLTRLAEILGRLNTTSPAKSKLPISRSP